MLTEGFHGQASVYADMEKFAKPEGMWGQFDGYPLDNRATRWFFDINRVTIHNADYMTGDRLPGRATSPYPPCDPHELAEAARRAPTERRRAERPTIDATIWPDGPPAAPAVP